MGDCFWRSRRMPRRRDPRDSRWIAVSGSGGGGGSTADHLRLAAQPPTECGMRLIDNRRWRTGDKPWAGGACGQGTPTLTHQTYNPPPPSVWTNTSKPAQVRPPGSTNRHAYRSGHCLVVEISHPEYTGVVGRVDKSPNFLFWFGTALEDTPRGPTATNRQPPPTANHCSIPFLWFCVLPMS